MNHFAMRYLFIAVCALVAIFDLTKYSETFERNQKLCIFKQ